MIELESVDHTSIPVNDLAYDTVKALRNVTDSRAGRATTCRSSPCL